MLVLCRNAEPTAQCTNAATPDTGTTDRAAAQYIAAEKAPVVPETTSVSAMSASIQVTTAEITVKKSVFRAEVFYTDNAQGAKETVKRQKERYRDARHVVHAFVIGEMGAILGCSDDGEPAGTAGQPVLVILKGSGITNILLTVTRWFGGTLLGKGGLVKAYSTAAKEALAQVCTEPLIQKAKFTCECSYEDHNPLLRAAVHLPISFAQTEFAQTVMLSGAIPLAYCNEFAQLVTEITKGASSVTFSE
jgi:hypothetical protein